MNIFFQMIQTIDLATEQVVAKKDIPEDFAEFILELIKFTTENNDTRLYEAFDDNTTVINCISQIIQMKHCKPHLDSDDLIMCEKLSLSIANKLFREEKEAEEKIGVTGKHIKRGSLFQALIQDDSGHYSYLLAKVEHKDWYDGDSLQKRFGFPSEKKNVWKSAVIPFACESDGMQLGVVRVYTDNKAKYWAEAFLELREMRSDEVNTYKAFEEIDKELQRTIKKTSEYDYIHLRNMFIGYMKTARQFNYYSAIDELVVDYAPEEGYNMDYLSERLKKLPETKGFDAQFVTVPSAIKARRHNKFKPVDGIEIHIGNVTNMERVIEAFRDPDRKQYLKIYCPDPYTFQCFYRKGEVE